MIPYPLLFEPILKEKVWGGRRLESLGKKLPPEVPIGESWEVADLPPTIEAGRSVISNGPLQGKTLHDALALHRAVIMGRERLSPQAGFPLLIKYLDAADNLSVQVHPDEAFAAAHPEAHLKSEAWYVVAAEPGAVIYKGVRPDVTPDEFASHILDGTVAEELVAIEVHAGDCHYLPSGTCHALGAGILVAEIQTPSDTTFRVFDWGRTERELHIEQALQCIHFGQEIPVVRPPAPPVEVRDIRTTPLVRTGFFEIERIESTQATELEVVTSNLPLIWMVLTGTCVIDTHSLEPVSLSGGRTVLLPAGLRGAIARLEAGTTLLHVALPPPTRGLLA